MGNQEMDVFKIQRSMGAGPVIFYNRDMSVYANMPMTPELAMYMDGEYKIYVRGYIDGTGVLQITEKLTWQPW